MEDKTQDIQDSREQESERKDGEKLLQIACIFKKGTGNKTRWQKETIIMLTSGGGSNQRLVS